MQHLQDDDWENIVPYGGTGPTAEPKLTWEAYQAAFEIEQLIRKLNAGMPEDWQPEQLPAYPKMKPVFIHTLDPTDDGAIILIIRTGKDGIQRGMIALPRLDFGGPEMSEGPYSAREAARLAKRYAKEYGFGRVVVDIEGSQLWKQNWGRLYAEHEDPTHLACCWPEKG